MYGKIYLLIVHVVDLFHFHDKGSELFWIEQEKLLFGVIFCLEDRQLFQECSQPFQEWDQPFQEANLKKCAFGEAGS